MIISLQDFIARRKAECAQADNPVNVRDGLRPPTGPVVTSTSAPKYDENGRYIGPKEGSPSADAETEVRVTKLLKRWRCTHETLADAVERIVRQFGNMEEALNEAIDERNAVQVAMKEVRKSLVLWEDKACSLANDNDKLTEQQKQSDYDIGVHRLTGEQLVRELAASRKYSEETIQQLDKEISNHEAAKKLIEVLRTARNVYRDKSDDALLKLDETVKSFNDLREGYNRLRGEYSDMLDRPLWKRVLNIL